MDDVSLSSAGRLFQMTAADTANAVAPRQLFLFTVPTVLWCQPSGMTSTGYCRDLRCSHLPKVPSTMGHHLHPWAFTFNK